MKDSILIPIRPIYVDLIFSGLKTIELRKRAPKLVTPFTAYVYETQGVTVIPWCDEEGHMIFKGRGKIVGQFTCSDILYLDYDSCGGGYWKDEEFIYVDLLEDTRYNPIAEDYFTASCVSRQDLFKYTKGKRPFGLVVSNPIMYSKAFSLSDFGLKRAPQTWCYVSRPEADNGKIH